MLKTISSILRKIAAVARELDRRYDLETERLAQAARIKFAANLHRHPVDMGFYKATHKDINEGGVLIGGDPGVGKSLAIKTIQYSLAKQMLAGAPIRKVIVDTDNTGFPDEYAMLGDIPGIKFIYADPTDVQGDYWDYFWDYRGTTFQEFANALNMVTPGGQDRFWVQTANDIVALTHVALEMRGIPDPRYAINILRDRKLAAQFLELIVPDEFEQFRDCFGLTDMAVGIRAHVNQSVRQLMPFAVARIHGKGRWSIEEVLAADRVVLILPYRPHHRTMLEPFTGLALTRLIEKTLAQPKDDPKEHPIYPTYLFLDEMRLLGTWLNAQSSESLRQARYVGRATGLGVITAFQLYSSLLAVMGKDRANELVGLFSTKWFFKTSCMETCQWMSSTQGTVRGWEAPPCVDEKPQPYQKFHLPAFDPEYFRALPRMRFGRPITAFIDAHEIGVFKGTQTLYLDALREINSRPKVAAYTPRPEHHYRIPPFTPAEVADLLDQNWRNRP